jgi:V-type H+-transporting ATPase subunit H
VLICFATDSPSLASALVNHPDPYKPFLPLLHHSTNPEDPIPLLASDFLTSVVSTGLISSPKPSQRDEEALSSLYAYLSTLTKNQNSGLQDIGVQGFSALLRTRRARELFWDARKQTVDPLVNILRNAATTKDNGSTTLVGTGSNVRSLDAGIGVGVGLQLLYHVLLVIWQLSFEGSLVGNDLES